jgi:hypothetical protein
LVGQFEVGKASRFQLTLEEEQMNVRILAAIAAAAFLLVGCRTVPILNVKDVPVNVPAGQTATLATVEQAIIRAGNSLGWQMKVEKPGLIVGTLNLRTHTAIVDIPFTPSSFSIIYKSSVNLEQKGDTIHSNYNGWVQNLDQAIRRQLLT